MRRLLSASFRNRLFAALLAASLIPLLLCSALLLQIFRLRMEDRAQGEADGYLDSVGQTLDQACRSFSSAAAALERDGVLSQVLVRDRTSEEVQTITDGDFLRRGGRSRRVLTMPGKSSYQAMRYSGEYQLARAREELRTLELELPGTFAAWPGELVELRLAQNVGTGLWRVGESVSALAERGGYTRLTLAPPDAVG